MPQIAVTSPIAMDINQPLQVVGYIRVSSEEQLENNSYREQARAIEEWCERRGYHLVAIYFDAMSGKEIAREGLQAAIDWSKSNPNVHGICFFHFNRFFRDLGYSEQIRKDLMACGKGLFSTQQDIDLKDKYGQFSFQIQQAIAELQRKEIVELLHDRRMAKGRAGGWIGGRIPYGKKAQQGELEELDTDRRNMRLVRRLRKWVRSGPKGRPMTQEAIAEYMNGKMRMYCPLDGRKFDPEKGIAMRADYGPKHTQPKIRARRRPYKRPWSGRWTYRSIDCILVIEGVPRSQAPRRRNVNRLKPSAPADSRMVAAQGSQYQRIG